CLTKSAESSRAYTALPGATESPARRQRRSRAIASAASTALRRLQAKLLPAAAVCGGAWTNVPFARHAGDGLARSTAHACPSGSRRQPLKARVRERRIRSRLDARVNGLSRYAARSRSGLFESTSGALGSNQAGLVTTRTLSRSVAGVTSARERIESSSADGPKPGKPRSTNGRRRGCAPVLQPRTTGPAGRRPTRTCLNSR